MKWMIDKSRLPSFVRVVTSGEPTLHHLKAMWQEIIESDFWYPGLTVLVDNRILKPLKDPDSFTTGAIEFFTANKAILGKACIAVISNQPDNFKYARRFQYGIRLGGSDAVLQLFGTETQALAWLNYFHRKGNEKVGHSTVRAAS
jgi:hypothetical protein